MLFTAVTTVVFATFNHHRTACLRSQPRLNEVWRCKDRNFIPETFEPQHKPMSESSFPWIVQLHLPINFFCLSMFGSGNHLEYKTKRVLKTTLPIFSCTISFSYTSILTSILCIPSCYFLSLEFFSFCLKFPSFHSLIIKIHLVLQGSAQMPL